MKITVLLVFYVILTTLTSVIFNKNIADLVSMQNILIHILFQVKQLDALQKQFNDTLQQYVL